MFKNIHTVKTVLIVCIIFYLTHAICSVFVHSMVCIKGPLLPQCSSYKNIVLEHKIYHEDALIEHYKKHEVYEKERYFVNPPKKDTISQGERNLRDFEQLVYNGGKYKPHKFQRGFLQQAVKGLAELLVGADEWRAIGPTIIKQRGWKEMSKMILAKAPRRFGKSIAVGRIVIAFAIIMPGTTVCVSCDVRNVSLAKYFLYW